MRSRDPADAGAFSYIQPPFHAVFAPGAARQALSAGIEPLGARALMLISSPRRADLIDEMAAESRVPVVARFLSQEPHVPAPVADQARRIAEESGADCLVSLGGGSAIGAAKAVALTTGLPIIAIPTTYSGSETTPVWGITEDGVKRTGRNGAVLPRMAIYDTALFEGMPRKLEVESALNALAHAVEAFWAPGRNPITALAAEEAVGRIFSGLTRLDKGEPAASVRGELLYGAFLAGTSFAVAGSGVHHKLCHMLGGTFGLPHATTHAALLRFTLALNADAGAGYWGSISEAMGAEPVSALTGLYSRLGAPMSLAEAGLRAEQLGRACREAAALLPIDNPVPLDAPAMRKLIEHGFEGRIVKKAEASRR